MIKKEPSTFAVAACVTLLHGVLFLIISLQMQSSPVVPQKERLIVKTVQLEPKIVPIRVIPEKVLAMEESVVISPIEEPVVIKPPEEKAAPTRIQEEPIPDQKVIKEEIKPKSEEKKPKIETPKKKEDSSLKSPPPKKKTVKKEVAEKPKTVEKKITSKAPQKKKKETEVNKKKAIATAPLAKNPGPSAEEKKRAEEREARLAKQKTLLARAKESIAKIDTHHDTLPSNESMTSLSFGSLKSIENLKIDALPSGDIKGVLSDPESSYIAELKHRLELMLRLPERGDVKVLLTLNRSGTVEKVDIVNTKSDINKKYVESKLPQVTFTNFGTNFANHEKYTFQITLKNQ
jgi:outer membrane biosynthesis protein TonB